ALPSLLPGGRLVTDPVARAEVERHWGVPGALPSTPGRDVSGIIAAAAQGQLSGLLIGGGGLEDLADPELAAQALERADFVVGLGLRHGEVAEHADVVLPAAASAEKSGSCLNWGGRRREFRTTIGGTGEVPDCRVLDSLAIEMDVDLFTQTPEV